MNSEGSRQTSKLIRVVRGLLICLALIGCLAGMLVSCQSKLIYYPRPYSVGLTSQWQKSTGGVFIDYQTSRGQQRAFLQGNLKSPEHLWMVCAGNGSVALDWSEWLAKHGASNDAYLLFDYPGYGDCNGIPGVSGIKESLTTVVPVAWTRLGWSAQVDGHKMRFLGHSLGAAVALMAATEYHIQKGVIISPFTSTMDMANVMIGLPVGCLVTQRYDNSARLAELESSGDAQVILIHGAEDEVIPVEMGRQLKADHPKIVQLVEIVGGHHNDLPLVATDQIMVSMNIVAK